MTLNFLQTSLIFFCCMVITRGISGTSDDDWTSATATYSRTTDAPATIGGACGFRDPSKLRVAGLSTVLFRRGAACGGCFVIRCVDHILWCLSGSPPVVVTATDFCAPNYGLPIDDGGWCNDPNEHFELSESAFTSIAERRADMVPVQYMRWWLRFIDRLIYVGRISFEKIMSRCFDRVKCEVDGGMRFTLTGSLYFLQVLISNVGWDGEVTMVKVKGWRTGWIAMARNWGQNWQCGADLIGQSLSFEVSSGGRIVASYNVAPAGWRFGQTFEGKQFEQWVG